MNSLFKKTGGTIPSLYVKSAPATYNIRRVFQQARFMAPCLLIFEDIDTVVTKKTRSYFFNEVDGLGMVLVLKPLSPLSNSHLTFLTLQRTTMASSWSPPPTTSTNSILASPLAPPASTVNTSSPFPPSLNAYSTAPTGAPSLLKGMLKSNSRRSFALPSLALRMNSALRTCRRHLWLRCL